MSRAIGFFWFLTILLGMPAGAGALDSPALDRAAADYQSSLLERHAARPEAAELLAARAWEAVNRLEWEQARDLYEAAIGRAPETAGSWLWLARSWIEVDAAHVRARAAAWRGYRLAGTDEEKAAGLALLGSAAIQAGDHRQAFEALSESLSLKQDLQVQSALDKLLRVQAFRAARVDVQADSDRPRFCIDFSKELASGPAQRYDDYLRVAPAPEGGWVRRDKSLCADGVAHGTRYRVTVLAGLPAADGDETLVPETLDVEVGDRPAGVSFKGHAYVLPAGGSKGVPVMSVNVDRVRLEILRVNERNLIEPINEGSVARLLDGWDIDRIARDSGERLWRGEMDVEATRNKTMVTAFPVDAVLEKTEPGVYILVAAPADAEMESWTARATQWLVISDLGVSSLKGRDGLHVFVRSLADGKAKADAEVRLMARNNGLLARATTGRDGVAHFDPGLLAGEGGREPKAVYVSGSGNDFNFLDLTGPAFDLSDRGVGGRDAPGPLDAFLYADRGVYRPGETAHVMALLRDGKAEAVAEMPLSFKVLRPDGVEAMRRVVRPGGAGSYRLDLPVSATAQTGRWSVQLHVDPEGEPLRALEMLVEDVVPPRIEVKLEAGAEALVPGRPVSLTVDADYLYGAPAAGLAAEGEAVILADEAPYPDWPGYRFGLDDETVQPRRVPLAVERTDADGEASVTLTLDGVPDATVPLKAAIRAGVFEPGGRAATASLSLPLHHQDVAIGIKPQFIDEAVAEGQEAAFEVVALDAGGARLARDLEYRLIEEQWTYQWFQRGNAWDYEVAVIDRPLAGGPLAVGADAPARFARAIDWGRYRFEVFDPETGAATSLRFRAGWFVSSTVAETPDRLEVTTDRDSYRPGDRVRVHIKPPFAGDVLINVVNDRLLDSRTVRVLPEGATVEFRYDESWGVGAYVLATAFRPDAEARGPGRAIGIAWLGLDAAPRTLDVALEAPARITPRGPLSVPLRVSGADGAPAAGAFVTLAAVDDGILQLTGFETPDPAGHYFGKRRLAAELRDLYGRLIDGKAGRRGIIRSGAGDPRLAGRGAPPVDVRIVSLFSGPVALDAEGRATVRFEVPAFAGRLRLMAVAHDATRLGAAEASVVVRDPLVAEVSRPRFLAPGDESRIALRLHNLDAPAGDYRAEFRAEGAVALKGEGVVARSLAQGESVLEDLDVVARDVGTGRIAMTLTGPGGFERWESWALAVRPAQLPTTRRLARRLTPGETLSLHPELFAGFRPESAEALLAFSPRPAFDVPGLLRALDRYPYGCLEQTTSRALPLLYVADVARAWGAAEDDATLKARLREAVGHILEMQRPDGGFALWAPDGAAEVWLTAYAADFLTRARAKDVWVSGPAYRGALGWLAARLDGADPKKPHEVAAAAYGAYALATAGADAAGLVRYLSDRLVGRLPSAMAAAQMGAALALYGEADRARTYFGWSVDRLKGRASMRDYGSDLRDLAGLVTLAAETESTLPDLARDWGGVSLAALVEDLVSRQAAAEALSTQEMAWLVLAAAALGEDAPPMRLEVNGEASETRAEPFYRRLTVKDTMEAVAFRNAGDEPLWHSMSVTGVFAEPQPAASEGFAISRGFYTLDGQPVDPEAVHRNDLLVVLIDGEATGDDPRQALVVDLLPAGLEVENARLADARSADEMGWLPELSETAYQEYRDDRFVAALDLGTEERGFAVAYLVRAVTPGRYALPATRVEDMYRPQLMGRTAMGRMTVSARP